jgi:hypothetical protein
MKYEGEWKNNERHGYGKLYTLKGEVLYEGLWAGDLYNGPGTYCGEEGDSYTGEWKNGKRHGIGTYVGTDGVTYEGEWANDQRHGKGVERNASGEIISDGTWKKNELQQ